MRVVVGKVFNVGPLSFEFVPIFFPAANSTIAVSHRLNSDAVGWSVVSVDKFCKIMDAPTSNTSSSVALQSDTASVSAVLMLVAVNVSQR